jgi:hypothetical protein
MTAVVIVVGLAAIIALCMFARRDRVVLHGAHLQEPLAGLLRSVQVADAPARARSWITSFACHPH